MEKDQIFFLKDRGVIFINGNDAKEFLQNIVTNDINKANDTSSCFASLLTPQGKYLFDFIIVKHKNGYFLDCEKKQLDKLVDKLNIYKLNSNIEILNLSNEFEVAVISKDKFLSLNGSKDIEGNTLKYNNDTVILDPRLKSLGGRIIANLEKLTLSLKNLGLKIENSKKYYDLSHKLGIPQINTIDLQEKIFGLECNFEELNGIDFKKGCYVGQENTARMKLKNKLRRKLVPLKSDKKLKAGSDVNYKDIKIGKVLISEPYPFALIKTVDPDFSEFRDKELLVDKNKSIIIQ
ncbi:MAG: folate-binding protein [Pelagibacteraceae bacterium TMED247]|nr:aminomethyltransferase [Candidatus Pelagibacter sp.]RPG05481.1 MAG: folate-binding protein [Pelagibacteraceae bacterium TMED247]